ncbi:hypothetical protein CANMA_002819 [Candida margitis]|uniref:uncharacterized protein n=1 Tax=Candida margitis TaxID=1775924 RepID=UPI002225E42B|nr:uncharacterized protein CANMA_002819 [Candida margitis]KAI5967639.1 hypothetical protein CANMA_002819 [Candida margitis]
MSFTLEKKQTKAHPIRANGATLIAEDAKNLTVVYNKYKSNCPRPNPQSQLTYNLVFCHGTGFNKSIWNYHIKKLYQLSQSLQVPWFLDTVISADAVGHGDSSLANDGKLGPVYTWDDGARDVIEVVQHETRTTGDLENDFNSRTVIIGHSMGGFVATYAAYLEPTLFDSVVAIEPVLFGTPDNAQLYIKLFNKISQLILDTFDTETDARFFFEKFSFTKFIHPEVMNDFIADEIYKTKNEEGEDIYKVKCLKDVQVAAYLGSMMSLPKGMLALPALRVPFLHVIGSKAKWNPPESVAWVRGAIDPQYFVGGVDIKDGEHLVNAEKPDEVVAIIKNFLTKRDEVYTKERSEIPEVVLKGDRKALHDQEFGKLLRGDLEDIYGYELAKHAPFDLTLTKKDSKL